MLENLRHALDKYREYRHPRLGELHPSEVYALFPEEGEKRATLHWPQPWPNGERAGVYLIFGGTGKLLYVGKAWIIGRRLSNYFQYDLPASEAKPCRVVHDWGPDPEQNHPMYVVTVPVPNDATFEAASLEEYLIREVNPSMNQRRLREVA
jgi:hypothetical protein